MIVGEQIFPVGLERAESIVDIFGFPIFCKESMGVLLVDNLIGRSGAWCPLIIIGILDIGEYEYPGLFSPGCELGVELVRSYG